MFERRKPLRITEHDAITYEVMPIDKTGKNITGNLSIGGIRFFSDKFIPVSSVLKVEIRLKHSDRQINAIVKVKWIRECFDDERYDLGAEFIDLSSEDEKFLNDYLYKKPR